MVRVCQADVCQKCGEHPTPCCEVGFDYLVRAAGGGMSDAQQEMNLEQYVGVLHANHKARKEYEELIQPFCPDPHAGPSRIMMHLIRQEDVHSWYMLVASQAMPEEVWKKWRDLPRDEAIAFHVKFCRDWADEAIRQNREAE